MLWLAHDIAVIDSEVRGVLTEIGENRAASIVTAKEA
jgi:hypothetical protein